MTTADILDGIIAKAKEMNLSNQQVADRSGVPKPTVDRIWRRDTQNPSIQTILDLAAAVGYTFSNHPEQIPAAPRGMGIQDPLVQHIISVYEDRGRSYEERIKRNTAHFNGLLQEKNRWLKFSLTLNIILVVFICSILIYDARNLDVGWIREQLAAITGDSLRGVMMAVQMWFDSIQM